MSVFTDVAAIVTAATAVAAIGGGYVQFVLKRSVLPSADFDVEFMPHFVGPEHLVCEVQAVIRNVGTNMLIVTNVGCRVIYRLVTDADVVFPEEATEPAFLHKALPRGGAMYGGPVPSRASSSRPWAAPSMEPGAVPSLPNQLPMGQTPPSLPSLSPTASAPSGVTQQPSVPPKSVDEERSDKIDAATPDDDWVPLVLSRTFIQPGVVQRYRKPIVLPAQTALVHVWGRFDYHMKPDFLTSFLIDRFALPPKELNLDWRQGITNHTVRRTFSVAQVLP